MTAPDAPPPAVWWSASAGQLVAYADVDLTLINRHFSLPADAVRLVALVRECAATLDARDGLVYVCTRTDRHTGETRDQRHDDGDGTRWWSGEFDATSPEPSSAALAGTTTPTANVVALLLEACRDAEDNRPPCDCAGPPDFGDGIYGSHEGDCASYEFPAVQASYIRELLASTPTTEETDGDH